MQDQLQQTLQQQLRDVHLPDAISWWPLAYGWWILLVLILLTLVGIVWLWRKRRNNNQYRKAAASELQSKFANWQTDQDIAAYLKNANAILKRCMLHSSSDRSDVTQSGDAWAALIQTYIKQPLSPDTCHALSKACYQPNPQVNIEAIHTEVMRWISSHREVVHA